jgi:hypothetical protein
MRRKVINIDENIHSALKEFCGLYGYKITKFVEILIAKEIKYVDPNMSKVRQKP